MSIDGLRVEGMCDTANVDVMCNKLSTVTFIGNQLSFATFAM